jgi:hypothetical protein
MHTCPSATIGKPCCQRAVQRRQAEPGAAREGGGHPRRLRVQAIDVLRFVSWIRRQQDRQAIGHVAQVRVLRRRVGQVIGHQEVGALPGPRAPERDELGQVAVALAVLRQQDQ